MRPKTALRMDKVKMAPGSALSSGRAGRRLVKKGQTLKHKLISNEMDTRQVSNQFDYQGAEMDFTGEMDFVGHEIDFHGGPH